MVTSSPRHTFVLTHVSDKEGNGTLLVAADKPFC